MKRLIYIAVFASCLTALAVTIYLMLTIFQSDMDMDTSSFPLTDRHPEHIVLISQEQGSYVMNEIQKGAREAGEAHGMKVDFSGVYRSNFEELLKQIDIAIASKVNGIIIEGVDRPEFELMVDKATERGIPVVTINSDAPGSLRKTYVGSDHYQEGILMGERIAADLGGKGVIGVVANPDSMDTDQLRLKGLREALNGFTGIRLVFASKDAEMLQPSMQAYDMLNHFPSINAFIGLKADSAKSIVQAGESRSRMKGYKVFMFDNSPQTVKLIQDGLVQAGLSQHYEEMGRMSVDLIERWLGSDQLPLGRSYYTPISIVIASDPKEAAR
ncbi:substrate-binding domain-containing protein [Paenibacillus sp. R14(2021)]|uniref:substrate-binding domain-containing protein n=1 Tax=Paenibacillus sp. R14(2021) TaxID=2859228 RepID=UPI001C6161C7|nr:substrate-binding domain-containing protein [Paenibacillus sp. R14(2021)]